MSAGARTGAATPGRPPVIEVRDLRKRFGGKVILDGASFRVPEGETLVVLGRSGGGKSVLLRHLVGLVQPDSGSVRVLRKELARISRAELYEVRLQIGVLFQGAALLDSMNVFDNVALGLRNHTALSDSELARVVEEKLALVGLPGIGNLMPAELSGGMRKRVGLARAIAMNPRLILYDEPTTGLDPVMADVINDLIVRIGTSPTVSAVVVTHDIQSAFKVGTSFLMLHQGRVLFEGDAEALRSCSDPRVAGFIAGRAEALDIL